MGGISKGYVPALDGVRALAAFAVLFFHARFPGTRGGFIGVDVFFVLSGYLITHAILSVHGSSQGFSYTQFMRRRFTRLYPALLVVLVAFFLTSPLLFPKANLWNEVALSGLYLTDYSRAFYKVPKYLVHTWSLSVEMHFYLIWPLVVLLLARLKREVACSLLIAGFFAIVGWRAWVYLNGEGWYQRLDTRASALILGGAMAFYIAPQLQRVANPLGLVCAVALVAGVHFLKIGSFDYASWGGALVELCASGLIIAALTSGTYISRALSYPPLVTLGLWSYSIYLWHYPISRLTRGEFDGVTSTAITLAATLPLAAATYYFVELRFYRRQADKASPAPTARPQEA